MVVVFEKSGRTKAVVIDPGSIAKSNRIQGEEAGRVTYGQHRYFQHPREAPCDPERCCTVLPQSVHGCVEGLGVTTHSH